MYTCSICGETSVSICVYCTKDACPNHLCERCGRCSDCCECDILLDEHPEHEHDQAAQTQPAAREAGHVELPVEEMPAAADPTEPAAHADVRPEQPAPSAPAEPAPEPSEPQA